MSAGRNFTLLVSDGGARLLDRAGARVAERATAQAEELVRMLPNRAQVQLVLTGAQLRVVCAEVPRLAAREYRDVVRRVAREGLVPPGQETPHVLEPEPSADGGHVLWIGSLARTALDPWLKALAAIGAWPLAAVPWQRALLAAGPRQPASLLYLTLAPGEARLTFFRGRSLRFTRSFALPRELDLAGLDPATLRELARMAGEELTLLLQFLRQKHKGEPPAALAVIGLPAEGAAALAALELPVLSLGPDLDAFLAQGAERERQRGSCLDLVPEEVRHARRAQLARAVVRTAVAGVLAIGVGLKLLLDHQERSLAREALQAEAAAQHRLVLTRDGEEAARLRFGLLRLRRAEERQRKTIELLERLGVRLLQAPGGVELTRVEVTQAPGDDLALRFLVEGRARTGRLFSLGLLATYFNHLKELAGIELEPLKDVSVADGGEASEPAGMPDAGPAQARFRIGGTLR